MVSLNRELDLADDKCIGRNPMILIVVFHICIQITRLAHQLLQILDILSELGERALIFFLTRLDTTDLKIRSDYLVKNINELVYMFYTL